MPRPRLEGRTSVLAGISALSELLVPHPGALTAGQEATADRDPVRRARSAVGQDCGAGPIPGWSPCRSGTAEGAPGALHPGSPTGERQARFPHVDRFHLASAASGERPNRKRARANALRARDSNTRTLFSLTATAVAISRYAQQGVDDECHSTRCCPSTLPVSRQLEPDKRTFRQNSKPNESTLPETIPRKPTTGDSIRSRPCI
jgi:hypothetical protein